MTGQEIAGKSFVTASKINELQPQSWSPSKVVNESAECKINDKVRSGLRQT